MPPPTCHYPPFISSLSSGCQSLTDGVVCPQVFITCSLISLEVGVSVTMLVLEPAAPTTLFPALDRVVLACNTTPLAVVAPLAFDFLLIALCTLYAIKTRNVPENFNEAKFIGFAMYTTCVIWVAFVPIYFGSDSKVRFSTAPQSLHFNSRRTSVFRLTLCTL